VKHWITLNEPYGPIVVVASPQASLHLIDVSDWQRLNFTGGDSGVEPFLVARNQLLAHAAAVKL
jgi:beta-glucosidase